MITLTLQTYTSRSHHLQEAPWRLFMGKFHCSQPSPLNIKLSWQLPRKHHSAHSSIGVHQQSLKRYYLPLRSSYCYRNSTPPNSMLPVHSSHVPGLRRTVPGDKRGPFMPTFHNRKTSVLVLRLVIMEGAAIVSVGGLKNYLFRV